MYHSNPKKLIALISFSVVLFFAGLCTQSLFVYTSDGISTEWLDFLMINISFVGDAWFCLLLIAFLFFVRNEKRTALIYSIQYLFVMLVTQCIKNRIAGTAFQWYAEDWTPKQSNPNLRYAFEYYFPSGYMAIATLHFIYLTKKFQGKFSNLFFGAMLMMVAMSNFFLGNANLFNLLLGAMVSIAGVVFMNYFMRIFNKLNFSAFSVKDSYVKEANELSYIPQSQSI